jgi:acyl-CoA synthetase (AMP-forming)/AMP-acid ligase II
VNVTEPIRRIARLTPEAVAIVCADDTTITYAQLDRTIDRMTVYAARLGLRAGDIAGLAILPPDEAPSLILALALARMGVASAAPSLPEQHMRLCFQASRPGRPAEPGRVAFDASWMMERPAAADQPPVPIHDEPNAILRIFASSGTTGVAKHIPISHELMTRRVFGYELGLGGGRCTRMITIGLGIAWSICTVLRTLWQGGTIVLFHGDNPIAAIRKHRVTWVVASPVALRTLLDAAPAGPGRLASLETVEVGGSTLPDTLQRQAVARLCPGVVSLLGSAEGGGIAGAPVSALGSRPGAVGFVFPGVKVEAVSDDRSPLPPGSEGILRIRSDTVADGYFGEAGPASEGLVGGWFYPGDIGTVWPDGMLSLSGRTSELINTGGVKVSPAVIEAGLLALPSVTDAAAFGVPDASGLHRIWAAIVASEPIEDAVLAAYCDKAPGGNAPQVIFQVEALPRNENGKIKRDVLIEVARQMSQKPTGG